MLENNIIAVIILANHNLFGISDSMPKAHGAAW